MNDKSIRAIVLILVAAIAPAAECALLRVVFVDASRPASGNGTYENPFATIGEAVRAPADVIFVSESSTPYEESVALKRGQMLVGAGYGLDALRVDLAAEFDAPSVPAVQGAGTLIHGTITLPGDNVLAGFTVLSDAKNAMGVSAHAPQGPIQLRSMQFRTSNSAYALYLGDAFAPFTWTAGGIEASDGGSGIFIQGGSADAVFDHVSIGGDFSRAIEVRGRSGGEVRFRNGTIHINNATRDGLVFAKSVGSIVIDEPLRIRTIGSRGFVAEGARKVVIAPGASIETNGGTALDVRDSGVDLRFDRIQVTDAATGVLLDRVRGRVEIDGGSLRSSAMRATQSKAGIRIRNVEVANAELFLRHVDGALFEKTTLDRVSINNSTDVEFVEARMNQLAADELRGPLVFKRTTVNTLTAGQQFNSGSLNFYDCVVGPLRAAVSGGRLDVIVIDGSMGGIDVQAKGTAFVTVNTRGARFTTPSERSIDIQLADAARACFDAERNVFSKPIRIRAAPPNTHVYVMPSVGERNGGVQVVIDANATSVTTTCP